MDELRFPKRNGGHADVLAAVGAADLLSALKPVLVDEGNEFRVKFARAVEPSDLDNVGPGFKFTKAKNSAAEEGAESGKKRGNKKTPDCVPAAYVFDYASENDKYQRQRAAKASRDQSALEAAQQDKSDPEFRVYRIAKALQADSGLNKFVERFFELSPAQRQQAIVSSLQNRDNFFFQAPLVQLFNPQAAKGYALVKPIGTDRNDKTKERWAEPFDEWLRYRGFFAGCAGWFLGSKGEHIRVYSPIPSNIPFMLYRKVAEEFRAESLAGSAPKLDCLGALRLTRILIRQSPEFARPSRSISGVWVVHYQSMGRVPAVTVIDRLTTPNWFDLRTSSEAAQWLETLEEHDKVLRRLDDKVSEELGLLKQYRAFLQSQEREADLRFVEFLGAYGHHVFRMRGQGKWLLPQFTLGKVEAILQSGYKQVIEDPGFRAIADALRSATVSAQVAKRRGGDYREIQYGALPELRRKIDVSRDDFMRAIADFVSTFNAESARRYEQEKSGYRISQDDFARFAELMEKPNWEVTGALLCAIATCKLGKEEKEEITE